MGSVFRINSVIWNFFFDGFPNPVVAIKQFPGKAGVDDDDMDISVALTRLVVVLQSIPAPDVRLNP